MHIERGGGQSKELEPQVADAFPATFISRSDLYAIQRPDGRYACIREPLTRELVAAHLAGEITLGAYALDGERMACWLCLDADTADQWTGLWHLAHDLSRQDIPAYLETSRRGGHLWMFTEPIPGAEIRQFGKQLLAQHDLVADELFPKQDQLTTGPGSLVYFRYSEGAILGQILHRSATTTEVVCREFETGASRCSHLPATPTSI